MMNLHSVQIGRIAPLGPEDVPSGFVKRGTPDRIAVAPLGLIGDEQADLTVHGGPEKAVYGYAAGHYARWQAEYPEHADRLVPGGFGENLTIEGLDEDAICVGDIHQIGSAVLQVCQPRQPCFKLALHFEDNRMPRAMIRSGRAGWYYRVLEEGDLGAGDDVLLVERPHPGFRFSRLVQIVTMGAATRAELVTLSAMPELASSPRRRAQDRWRATD